jgi:hypothetical protein
VDLSAAQESGLRRLFEAARHTTFYRQWLREIRQPLTATLDLLPHIEPFRFDDDPKAFLNRRASRSRATAVRYPLTLPKKMNILSAPVHELRRLAATPQPHEYAVVAFTGIRDGALTQADRDLFWRAFRVPVFEQFRGLHGELLAEECEAHEGLHVIGEAAIFERRGQELVATSLLALRKPVLRVLTGLTGEIERGLCPCGRPGERLLNVAAKVQTMRKRAGAS